MTDINEKLDKGYVQTRAIIEILGKPKEHIENTLKGYVEKIGKNENIEILKKEYFESKEIKNSDGMWSNFVEIEILTKNVATLIEFCFDYMPSSVEIIEPKELKLKEKDLSGLLNDLQARLHKVDMAVKQINNQNEFMRNNINSLIRNLVSVLLLKGGMKLDDLSRFTGIKKEELEKFLDIMIKENRIKKEKERYILIKDK